tara:strand:- start:337 stop:678 length:342 start_codon:yes stop_codon:yes gene_type:complete
MEERHYLDPTTVILGRHRNPSTQKVTQVQSRKTFYQKDKVEDGCDIKYVTSDLKSKFIQARCALQPKQNRQQLASSLSVPVKDIQLIEEGKLTLKEAKQLCIKFERKYKIKLL